MGGQEGGLLNRERMGLGGRHCLGMGGRREGETGDWGRIAAVATTGTRFFINTGSVYKDISVGKPLPNCDFKNLSFIVLHTTYQMLSKGLLCALQAPPRLSAAPFRLSTNPCPLR